jgi:hypothetical protein
MPQLFAAAGDWLSVLIPLVVSIIWILNQVFSRLGQPQNPPRDVRRPMPPPQAGQRPQQARVDEEIEAFLRRAAQQRGQPQRPAAPVQTVQTAPSAAPRPLVQRAEALPSSMRRTSGDALVQVEMVDEEEEGEGMRGISVSEHVQKHLDTRSFEQRASHMTKVDQADEQLEERLHQAFDHDVGTLAAEAKAKQTAEAAATAVTAPKITAGSVSTMLKDRNSLRNAILMQEILRRPEERW